MPFKIDTSNVHKTQNDTHNAATMATISVSRSI